VASIYLAIEFLTEEQKQKNLEEEKSPCKAARTEAYLKFQTLCAGCKESEGSKEEKLFDYNEFSTKNEKWWSVHFNVGDADLSTACNLILSIYES
jgi:hypothetical protein